jgi:hypothetical protein
MVKFVDKREHKSKEVKLFKYKYCINAKFDFPQCCQFNWINNTFASEYFDLEYKTRVKEKNVMTGTVKMQKSISFCCEITIGEKQQGNFG